MIPNHFLITSNEVLKTYLGAFPAFSKFQLSVGCLQSAFQSLKSPFSRQNIASFLTLLYSRQSQTLISPIHFTAFHIFDLKIKLLKSKQYETAADFTELRP